MVEFVPFIDDVKHSNAQLQTPGSITEDIRATQQYSVIEPSSVPTQKVCHLKKHWLYPSCENKVEVTT